MNTRHLLATGGLWLGVTILVVLALPLLAVGAWVLRVLLLVAAITAAVSGCLLYCVHPRFRHWASHLTHHTPEASP